MYSFPEYHMFIEKDKNFNIPYPLKWQNKMVYICIIFSKQNWMLHIFVWFSNITNFKEKTQYYTMKFEMTNKILCMNNDYWINILNQKVCSSQFSQEQISQLHTSSPTLKIPGKNIIQVLNILNYDYLMILGIKKSLLAGLILCFSL